MAGTYVIRVENTLDGKKAFTFQGQIACGAEAATAKVDPPKDSKIESLTIRYGPPAKRS